MSVVVQAISFVVVSLGVYCCRVLLLLLLGCETKEEEKRKKKETRARLAVCSFLRVRLRGLQRSPTLR